MRARRSVWTDDTVQELLTKFVTVADEVGRLQRGGNAECEVFLGFCEQGHYGGRTEPTGTRQGIYAVAPSGRFLASVNTASPERMATMLRTALERWAEMPAAERKLDGDLRARIADTNRFEDKYPTDGLVLAQYSRDLDAGIGERDWRAAAWNEDQVWFTAAEAASIVPEKREVGSVIDVPHRLVERIACLHLVDSVRGQTPQFGREDITDAEWRSEIVECSGDQLRLRFDGMTRVVKRGRWRTEDRGSEAVDHERGVRTDWSGHATFNVASAHFEAFELLAIGERWGATQYNGRSDAVAPSPIGFAFVLAPAGSPRVAPAFWWAYGWR